MQQISFITSEMYKNGLRIESAKMITFNPFYHAGFDRAKASSYVQMFNEPVLRPSSIPTRFAMSFKSSTGAVLHSLLKQNPDLSIHEVSEMGVPLAFHRNIFALLDRVMGLERREEEIAHQPLPRLGEELHLPAEDPVEPIAEPMPATAGGAGASIYDDCEL